MAYFSEIKYLGSATDDFLEVAVPAGTDVSNIEVVVYRNTGAIRTTNALGTLVTTSGGQDIYVIDTASSASFDGMSSTGAVALVVDGTVVQFVSFDNTLTATEGPANGMTSTQIGTTGTNESLETTDDGSSYNVQTTPSPGSIPCFCKGTLIQTDKGNRPVETLCPGDLLQTRDNGLARLCWVGSRVVNTSRFRNPAFDPFRIPAGALGPGNPNSDLYVSGNHRILLQSPFCDLYFGEPEVLVEAKALEGAFHIHRCPGRGRLQYFHLALERHEILLANGCAAESLLVSGNCVDLFDSHARMALKASLPDQCRTGQHAARRILRAYEARALLKTMPDYELLNVAA